MINSPVTSNNEENGISGCDNGDSDEQTLRNMTQKVFYYFITCKKYI